MLGSLVSMGGYWMVLAVLVVWMCVRIWRSSPALALVTFFFWPASVLALFSNWGDRDSDIRIPFALALLTAGLVVFMAQRTVDKGVEELALALSQQEIEMIRVDNPELAIQLEEARADFVAAGAQIDDEGYLVEGYSDDDGYGDVAANADTATDAAGVAAAAPARDAVSPQGRVASGGPPPVPATAVAQARDPAELAAEQAHSLQMAALAVSWRLGKVALDEAGAVIAVPRGFRFAPRHTLVRLAWLRGVALEPGLAGWLVHQRTDLAGEDAWHVEVRFQPLERLPSQPDALARGDERALQDAAYVAELAYALAGTREMPLAPHWDRTHSVATWQRGSEGGAVRAHAARVLPHGVLVFSASGLAAQHLELATRSVRLMALRSAPLPVAPAHARAAVTASIRPLAAAVP